ncbi:MAG: type IX secretion system outer membrane channel protein PorV [Chitinophagaceae bacterium]|nr:type IX secretion system outer membrane channel protein PorV [Chitinophagaceae bacterium]
MKQLTLRLAVILFLFSSFSNLYAQGDRINVVTSAVPFLRISPDARAGGMGEVGIATLPDANAPFWNLAKTSFNTSPGGVSLTYTPWLKRLGLTDVFLATVAGYYKLDDRQAIAGSFRYFSLGDIQFTNNNGDQIGQTSPREFSLDAGYTLKLSEKIGLGIALRYINSSLAKNAVDNSGNTYKAGTAVAGDISFYYSGLNESRQGWSFGATLSNLGSKIGYTNDASQRDYIPANLGLGTAYTKVFDESSKITFGLDLNKLLVPTPPLDENGNIPADELEKYRNKGVVSSWFSSFGDAPDGGGEELREVQISAGAEYWYMDQFALRAGYFYEDKTKGNRKYFTLGAGLKYNVFGLNFSYIVPSGNGINQNPLSNTLRFGLVFDFNASEAE